MNRATGDTDVQFVVAELITHNYVFKGAGRDRAEARAALLKGWAAHRTALLDQYPERTSTIPDEHSIEAHFKIHYEDFALGGAYRDKQRVA